MARWRRKLTRVLLGLVGLVVVVVALALLALANLDARPMKSWVSGAAAKRGIALDFERGRITIGGLRFRNVRIASPPADAARAPDLVSIGSIEGSWSPLSRRVDELVIRDVNVTIVRDADGTTSLDRWLAGMPASAGPAAEPAAPPEPLSALGRALVPAGVEAHVRIEGVTVTVLDGMAPPRRLILTGLAAHADLAGGAIALGVGPSTLRMAIEPYEVPNHVGDAGAVVPEAAREVVIDVHGEVALAATGHGSVTLEATVQRQTLAPALVPVKQLIALAGTLDFAAAEHRTRLRVERLSVLDGAATLTAHGGVEDAGGTGGAGGARGAGQAGQAGQAARPFLEELALRIDLPAIARAVPPELGPLEVEGEPIVATVKGAALAPTLAGTLAVTGTLVRARWRELEVRGVRLGVDARPEGNGVRAELRLPIARLEAPGLSLTDVDATLGIEPPGAGDVAGTNAAARGAAGLWPLVLTGRASAGAITTPTQTARGLRLTARATARSATALDAELTADVASVIGRGALQGGHVDVKVRDLVLGEPALASAGVVHLAGSVASARDATGTRASAIAFTTDVTLAHAAPGRPSATATATATTTIDVGRLVVPDLATSLGPSFAGGPAHLELAAPVIELDTAEPGRSHGSATLAARYGGATVDGMLAGSLASVTWALNARAPRLGPSREVAVSSRGSYGAGRIAHDSRIELGEIVTAAAALRGARLHIVSSGTALQHQATISAAIDAPSSGGRALGSAQLEIAAKVDLVRQSLDVHVVGAQPAADLHVIAALDAARAIRWQARGHIAGLAAAAVVLPPGPDWARLSLDLDGHGVASGIVAGVAGGLPSFVPDPAATIGGHQAVTLTVREVHYADAAQSRADVEAATLTADVELGATTRAAVALDVPALAAVGRGVKLGAKALALRLDATLARHGVRRTIDARLAVRAASAVQSAVPWYAIAGPELEVTIAGDPEATLALAVHLANPGAGTAFDVAGDLERNRTTEGASVVARNSLALEGTLVQGLDGLAAAPDQLQAHGKVRVPFRVESGDLSLFVTTARVGLEHVDLDLPAARLQLSDVSGDLPVLQEFVVGPAGVAPVGQGEPGVFSQLRFPDYHPFAGAGSYLSIGEVSVRGTSFGPLAGNARIDHDVIALDQLELSALGGKITGQALGQLRGKDTRLAFRGKLTGVRPSAPRPGAGQGPDGDPLDANVAITLEPYRYGLEGRAEIVRIGRDHLRALLDVSDPYHADVAANRVRLALGVGYPKQVRLHFASGFASLAIELGGLAGVVRIDEMRGIPIGPALAHWLAPILEQP